MGLLKPISSYQFTGSPLPPLMIFSNTLKSKVPCPEPLSHTGLGSIALIGGVFVTFKSNASIAEVQVPSLTDT